MTDANSIPDRITIVRYQSDGNVWYHALPAETAAEGSDPILKPTDHERPALAMHLMATFWHVTTHPEWYGEFGLGYAIAEFYEDEELAAGPLAAAQLDERNTERLWLAWHAIMGSGDDMAAATRLEAVLRMSDDQVVSKSSAAGVR